MSREVPNGWDQLSLGDICTGGMLTDGDWIESKDQDPNGQIRLLQLSDIGDGEFLNKTRRFINEQTAERLKVTYLEKHDILLARMPDPLGRCCLLPIEERAITAVDVCVIRPSAATDRSWLSYLLNSPEIRTLINAQGTGTTRTRVSRKSLAALALMVPPLHEQRRIAEVLSSVDEAIAATRAVIEQTRKVKQGVLERLLTKGIGHTRFKQTAIGEIPEGWEVATLGSLSEFVTSGSRGWATYYSDNGAIFLRIANLTRSSIRMRLDEIQRVSLPLGSTEGARTRVNIGDILISITADLGIIGHISEKFEHEAYVNQHIALVRPLPEQVSSAFLAYALSGPISQRQFQHLNDSGAKAGLNLPTIRRFSVPLPPLDEQLRMVESMSSIDDAIETEEEHLRAQTALKAALMSDLLTGRKRVTDALPLAAE